MLTLGNFDGVHRGHQALIARCKEESGPKARVGVVTFAPHPALFLGKATELKALTPLRRKAILLRELGVHELFVFRFDAKFAALSAEEFVRSLLVAELDAQILVCGPDARVGRSAEGNVQVIERYMRRSGRRLVAIPFLEETKGRISSKKIRELLSGGKVRDVATLLGRNYCVDGIVRAGDKRGRLIGFPTINISPGPFHCPKDGVYATQVSIATKRFAAVTNVGVKPTFGLNARAIESHLFDFQDEKEQSYRARISIEFIERIRDEQKFGGIDELRKQIQQDCERARALHCQSEKSK